LLQKPHVEVADSKTLTVISDEERLAAGISTIGLQTKKPSGAQQRKLTRERRMKEGTWMENPPRKTPSQAKETVGSSGGMKRPHSDSSTPSIDKQQPKNPRNTQVQTGTYREAVNGFKMAIIHKNHLDVKLDQTQSNIIQTKLLTAADVIPLEEIPLQFLHSKFAQGVFWITCANATTRDRLMRTISGL